MLKIPKFRHLITQSWFKFKVGIFLPEYLQTIKQVYNTAVPSSKAQRRYLNLGGA
jgi:hypothetical protein